MYIINVKQITIKKNFLKLKSLRFLQKKVGGITETSIEAGKEISCQ